MKRILNHIKHFIYKRKELERLKLCLKVIKNAKIHYIREKYDDGMCSSFHTTLHNMRIAHVSYVEWININIPEFNAKYLTGLGASYSDYWWHICDTSSRIAAFDKLIKLYETKIKELC